MPNPVQIVLNDEAFLRAPEPGRMGPEKDFFSGDHAGFQRHKDNVLRVLEQIEGELTNSPFGAVAYLHVRMRLEAIAKSYRPSRALLTPDLFPCVGAAAPGELYFRLPLVHLNRLRQRIVESEATTYPRTSASGKQYEVVSRARSELGAIETIEIAPVGGKRTFSSSAAVQALMSENAASGYVVELFEQPPRTGDGDDILGIRESFRTLLERFQLLGTGLYAELVPSPGGIQSIEFQLQANDRPPQIEDRRVVPIAQSTTPIAPARVDGNVDRHERALRTLAEHPLVRRIRFPLIVSRAEETSPDSDQIFPMPLRIADGQYPKVGVVDTGIHDSFAPWVSGRHDFLNSTDLDVTHGTLVAGLLVGARSANQADIGREEDGCDLIDIPLMPRGRFLDFYGRRGFEAFLEELEEAIAEARRRFGVRVFNMSLNVQAIVEQNLYSSYAARLDDIQDRLGVVIVNSAGNLDGPNWRAPWPSQPRSAVAALAARPAADTILVPCESVRAFAVGALTPPGCSHVASTPATYTRRGPGLRVGLKPDLAHFGGAGDASNANQTGLVSCALDGTRQSVRGTSFSAPLVAKTVAALDAHTTEKLETRTLRAFVVHSARTPVPLRSRSLKEIARQFVGYGQPSDAKSMLETDDHSITLVFESRLTAGEKRPAILRFPFIWPASLVDPATRACRGTVRMTLVYDPPVDAAFGTEFVRVNLDALLQQRQPLNRKDGSPSWRTQVNQVFLPRPTGLTPPERRLIEHGLKWWPSKRYEDDFGDEGVGESAEWRLQVESVVRAEATFPAEGIPFSVILTLQDPDDQRPIFQEVRRQLVNTRVQLHDIRTHIRVRPRR
jgi:subtilase family protein